MPLNKAIWTFSCDTFSFAQLCFRTQLINLAINQFSRAPVTFERIVLLRLFFFCFVQSNRKIKTPFPLIFSFLIINKSNLHNRNGRDWLRDMMSKHLLRWCYSTRYANSFWNYYLTPDSQIQILLTFIAFIGTATRILRNYFIFGLRWILFNLRSFIFLNIYINKVFYFRCVGANRFSFMVAWERQKSTIYLWKIFFRSRHFGFGMVKVVITRVNIQIENCNLPGGNIINFRFYFCRAVFNLLCKWI